MAHLTEPNRRTIRAAFEAWQAGTGAIADVFAHDLVWRIEGHSLASREYGSRQAFVDEGLRPRRRGGRDPAGFPRVGPPPVPPRPPPRGTLPPPGPPAASPRRARAG